MKKILFSLLTLAAALTMTSCLKDVEGASSDPTMGGPTVEAEFTLNLDQLPTKAFADGTKATKLSYAFYDANGDVVESLKASKVDFPDANKINVKLAKGAAYTFMAWAEAPSSVYTISDDFKTVTMATTSLTANNDNYDAFYGTVAISTDDTKTSVSKSVYLKRPFAQINLLVPDENTVEYTNFKSAMTVKSAYASMNLLTGELTGDTADITFSATAAPTEPTLKENNKYLAMNYVFAPADAANFPVSFTVTPNDNASEAVTVDLNAVSLKRNRRTNLVGNIFKTQVDGSITFTINPTLVDPAEEEVLPTLLLTLPTGATSAGPSAVNLPLTVAGGAQTVSMSSPNSTGTISFGQAADTDVATVVDNQNGTATVTPNADGTTTFVGHIAAGETKAATTPVDVVFTVVVGTGVKAEAVATPTFSPAAGTYTSAQSVTINCETDGATIYYTTDGSAPTAESAVFSSPIAVNETMTIKAIAIKGDKTSEIATAAYTISAAPVETVATPTFSPAAGTYTSAQSVTINCETDGATIYYTTDGSAPTAESAVFSSPIAVNETKTIKAIAVKADLNNSAVAEATYTINLPVTTNTIADVLEQITSTSSNTPSEYSANLAGAVVSYVSGKYNYIEDATGAIILFMENSGLTAGQTISGTISGTGYKYNGTPQITGIGTSCTKTDGGTIPLTTVTLAELLTNYDSYLSRRIRLVGVTVTDGIAASGDRDGVITQNTSTIAVRSQLSSDGPVLTLNDIGDLIAFPAIYNEKKQLSFYETTQFSKTGVAPALSAATSATVNADVTSYSWAITSNTAWTITTEAGVTPSVAAGNGNAEVTLSFAANESSDAVTYTATVSADGCEDVTITITQNGTGTTSNPRYVKITSTSELTDGNYLIVYEAGNVAFNGGLTTLDVASNTIGVTINDGVIAQSKTVDDAVFTISAIKDGYSIKSSSGPYIGRTATSNGMNTSNEAILNTISFESNGSATINSNNLNLRYNKTSGQTRFRYFTSAQEVVHLYKYTE